MASPNMNPGGCSLGATPAAGLSDQSVRVQKTHGRIVRHHCARAQVREINTRRGKDLIEAAIAGLRQRSEAGALAGTEQQILVETHLFEPLFFSGNIEMIRLSKLDPIDEKPATPEQWTTIQINAQAFADKHAANLKITD